MARINTTPAIIVGAIIDRLVSQVAEATEHTCYESHPGHRFQVNARDVFITIWLDGGQFDQAELDGGMVVITANVTATIHSAILRDETGRDAEFLRDAAHGVLIIGHKIVKALTLYDLLSGTDEILREPMRPVQVSTPEHLESQPGVWDLTFEVKFDWSTTA
jgi:hypothetical protein